MFVSSYPTYLSNLSTEKTTNNKNEDSKESSKPFNLKQKQSISSFEFSSSSNYAPVDYIEKSNAFYNKLVIQQQLQDKQQNKSSSNNPTNNKLLNVYKTTTSIETASLTYAQNSRKFINSSKSEPAIHYPQKYSSFSSKEFDPNKSSVVRFEIVNTYAENEKFHILSA